MKSGSIKKLNFRKSFFIITFLVIFFFTTPPLIIFFSTKYKLYTSFESISEHNVGIVFGAGIKPNGGPSDMLYDRLAVTAKLYEEGKINKILVSGDNRFVQYDEPTVMKNSLINDFDIPQEDIYLDFAGRRTYDTCSRAKSIFTIDEAILITQEYHLYRAIYTCEALGIKSTGMSASLHNYIGEEKYFVRELLAQYKAFLDLYLFRPEVVDGNVEADL